MRHLSAGGPEGDDFDDNDQEDQELNAPWGATLSFQYGAIRVTASSRVGVVADPTGRQLFRRDLAFERAQRDRLETLSRRDPQDPARFRIGRKDLAPLIRELIDASWIIEAEGLPVRRGGGVRAKVRSSIDWFELEATIDFEGHEVPLPELLSPRAQSGLVRLADGSRGVAPVWVDRYLSLARLGRADGPKMRFGPAQAGLLDALLSASDEADVDVKFDRLRRRQADPSRVREPPGFRGSLRPYQREGVAWLESLRELGHGGCLADDMGLGKTVQVLCWLQGVHRRASTRPSLIVVPKSLVHNWLSEASKFTDLRATAYTGAARDIAVFQNHDLVVTTYGTLRADILKLLDLRFECLVLDEAQAIKNPASRATKAAKLVRAEHRVAISGTPIENSLAELWSIFDFSNPGLLGSLDEFIAPGREEDEGWLEMLGRALRPLMLRRTKDSVLRDLPGKTEQAILLELSADERRRYDELVSWYRSSLTERIAKEGLDASRLQVLEALLRLRQAACHPGLLDPSRIDEPSAKLDFLLERVQALAERGHKSLVFSQFTGLLRVVDRALRARGIEAAYLDGQTNDRQKVVEEFQTREDRPVFLISLKAGGCGLNLVQSDYVFLLDPWWNPAVEAQAIDRAYRMGQKRHVFAYRLIAKDTVEQKIVELQDQKRRLADAITGAVPSGNFLKDLDMTDLESLLAMRPEAGVDADDEPS
ncbi:MAG: DEAD/DEAH box helicase [Myxococcales bacterium]|nr:DEAD/DEAH box helicase [Myxococcales bacterium]